MWRAAPANIYIQSERFRWAMHHVSFQHPKRPGPAFFIYFAVKKDAPVQLFPILFSRNLDKFCTWVKCAVITPKSKPWRALNVLLCPLVFTPHPNHYQAKRITSPLSAKEHHAIYISPAHQSPPSLLLLWPSLNVRLLFLVTYTGDKIWMHEGPREGKKNKNRTSPWDEEPQSGIELKWTFKSG